MFKILMSGMLIGIASIIPGISGATLAVITNQYQRIIDNCGKITGFQFKAIEWLYLLGIAAAAILGIYLFSWPLDYGLTHFQAQTLTLIVGLVLGSLSSIQLSHSNRSIKARYLNAWFVLGATVIVILSGLTTGQATGASSGAFLYVISGAVAMIAMLIPGVSGAMILVLLGTYADVVQLIKAKDVVALLPFIVGAVIGGGVTVKGIQWLIKQYSDHFESFILGAIIGSISYIANQISWSTAHPVGLIAILVVGVVLAQRLTHAR